MNEQQIIDHEVRIRTLTETTESEFESVRNEFALMLKNSDDKFEAMRREFALMLKNSDDKFEAIEKRANITSGSVVLVMIVSIFLKVIGVF